MSRKKIKIEKFIENYKLDLAESIFKLDTKKLISIINFLEITIRNKKTIFTCGNGGAASVSNHFLCDFNKGVKYFSNKAVMPKVISLSNSIESITAIANDENYEKIFENQLENYVQSGDLLFAFSCSGNSKNVLSALKCAKKNKCRTILITGFSKKKYRYVDLHLNIDIKNYGISEDLFQSIMHLSSQYLKAKKNKGKLNSIM